MPNHNYNRLSVIGLPEAVDNFCRRARGERAVYKEHPVEKKLGMVPKEPQVQSFCYNALMPVPDEIKAQTYSDAGYDWQWNNWGVKWEVTGLEGPVFSETGPLKVATWYFYSPWGPPTDFFRKIAPDFKELVFVLSWGGEGPTLGRQAYWFRVELDYNTPEEPESPDFGDGYDDDYDVDAEEAWLDNVYRTWRNSMLTGHDAFVKKTLCELLSPEQIEDTLLDAVGPEKALTLLCSCMAAGVTPR